MGTQHRVTTPPCLSQFMVLLMLAAVFVLAPRWAGASGVTPVIAAHTAWDTTYSTLAPCNSLSVDAGDKVSIPYSFY
jgi:hypothetical protein